MTSSDELRDCVDAVERACSELIEGTPSALDRCTAALEAEAQRTSALLPAVDVTAAALAEAWRLRRTVRAAGALLENAAVYHRGWRDRLAVQSAGYAPGGLPGAVTPAGRIWVEA